MTKDGVEYRLKFSPFKFKYLNAVFYFSSQPHLDKFIKMMNESQSSTNDSLSNRFKVKVDITGISIITLYSKIETRGFLISVEGEYIECQENLKLSGELLIKKI